MFIQEIEARTKQTADGTEKVAKGTVKLYEPDDLSRLVRAGMLEEHCKKLNAILIIRAQDDLRKELVEEDPIKIAQKKLKQAVKSGKLTVEQIEALLK